jgi:hypothetical protein
MEEVGGVLTVEAAAVRGEGLVEGDGVADVVGDDEDGAAGGEFGADLGERGVAGEVAVS